MKRTGGEKFKTEKKRRTKGRKDQKYLDNSIVWKANWIEERLQKQGKRKEYNSVSGIEN